MSYRVNCILCSCITIDTFLGFSPGGIPHLPHAEFFPDGISPSAMCYLTNQWIAYNMLIDFIDAQALSKAIYITSFYMCLLAAHVKSLQSKQQSL